MTSVGETVGGDLEDCSPDVSNVLNQASIDYTKPLLEIELFRFSPFEELPIRRSNSVLFSFDSVMYLKTSAVP